MSILVIGTPISSTIYIPLAIGGIASLTPQERTINTIYIERLEGVIQLSSKFYSETYKKLQNNGSAKNLRHNA